MNQKLVELLLEYIDTRFSEHEAKDSSDGGLMERVQCWRLREDILDLVKNEEVGK